MGYSSLLLLLHLTFLPARQLLQQDGVCGNSSLPLLLRSALTAVCCRP
jgi:hypothetical protein